MNRKMLFWMSLAITLVTCSATSAWADSLTFDAATEIPYPFGAATPYDISAAGNLDWVVPGVDWKSGGTAIWTVGDNHCIPGTNALDANGSYPDFSYTDGTNSSAATVKSQYNYTNGYTTITLPAGSGSVALWWGDGGPAPYTLSKWNAWFGDDQSGTQISQTISNNSHWKSVVNYQTSAPRTLWVSTDPGSGSWNVGWFGIAVSSSSIPEPSALTLLGLGLTSLLAYAWRKRR